MHLGNLRTLVSLGDVYSKVVKATWKCTRIIQQFSFAVGHFINDVARLLMFSYGLVFLMKVVNMSPSNVGWIIVFSRVTNAIIFRPIAGYLCDKVSIPVLSRRHGNRKSWHLIGTVYVLAFYQLFGLQQRAKPMGTNRVLWHSQHIGMDIYNLN